LKGAVFEWCGRQSTGVLSPGLILAEKAKTNEATKTLPLGTDLGKRSSASCACSDDWSRRIRVWNLQSIATPFNRKALAPTGHSHPKAIHPPQGGEGAARRAGSKLSLTGEVS